MDNKNRKNSAPFVSPKEFAADGFRIKYDFLTESECKHLLSLVADYRLAHEVPQIYRKSKGRSLNYRVIDGLKIKRHLPEIQKLYQSVNHTVNLIAGENLAPLKNARVGVNVNITPPGGEYRWHYDRNRLTAILYLNDVEGGETEFYPNYRLSSEKLKFSNFQRLLDYLLRLKTMRRLFGRQVLLKPRRGALLLMRGDKCLHSVRPVLGDKDRINVILSYDAPDTDFAVAQRLDAYLYDQDPPTSADPNYM